MAISIRKWRPMTGSGKTDLLNRLRRDNIAPYFDDLHFLPIFCSYYTDIEPGSSFVATDGDAVVGYLFGCPDTRRYNRVFYSKIIPSILGRALRGRYRIGRKTRRYIGGMIGPFLLGGYRTPPLDLYPAHLHINIMASIAGWSGASAYGKLLPVPCPRS